MPQVALIAQVAAEGLGRFDNRRRFGAWIERGRCARIRRRRSGTVLAVPTLRRISRAQSGPRLQHHRDERDQVRVIDDDAHAASYVVRGDADVGLNVSESSVRSDENVGGMGSSGSGQYRRLK